MSQNAKELIFEEEARNKLRDGIDVLANVVGVTLGPKGLNVCLESSWGPPSITNDGNSIVKDVEIKDQYVNMGIALGKEAANKMKEKCGDGTTSTILLLRAFVQNGVKNVASGASPITLKRGMDKAVDAIVAELEKNATAVKSDDEMRNIAIVSASGSVDIGNTIAEAIKKVGKSGVITIEEGKTTETTVEIVKGMYFDRGYISAYFATNTETRTAELQRVKVLITDKKISSVQEVLPILQALAASAEPLLIIADDIEGDALSTLVINKLRGSLKVCAIKAPGFGDSRKAQLEDIAILTGATVVSEETGLQLKDATAAVLGSAEMITVTKDKTTVINGAGDAQAIQARIKQLEAQSAAATSSYDKEKLEERKAKLSGGVAVIRVGAATEPALKQKKQVFQDSLSSTRAAQEEGILPGGGIALLRASRAAESLSLTGDEALGVQIVVKACQAPFKQIVSNCGLDSSIVLAEVMSKEGAFGFNALTGKNEDLLKAGVIDPLKVIKNSLLFSCSTAGVILLSEVLIGNAPEEEDAGKKE